MNKSELTEKEKNGTDPDRIEEKKQVVSKSVIFLLLFSMVLIAASFISFIIYFNNPIRTVERYFDAVVDKNWDTVYNMLELEDYGQFLNKESYISVMEEQYFDIDSFTLKKNGKATYEMTFTANGTRYRSSVATVEQTQREMLLFRKYKIQPIDLVAENIWIRVPEDIRVSLNGIELGDEYLQDTEENSSQNFEKTYCIPQLYIGTYVIGLSGPYYQECTEEFSVENNGQILVPELPYLKEEIARNVLEMAQEETNRYYEKLMSNMNSDSCLTNVKLSDLEMQIIDYGYEDSFFYISVCMDYHVNACKITKITDEYTQISFYEEEELSYQEEKKYSFQDDDGNWLLYQE